MDDMSPHEKQVSCVTASGGMLREMPNLGGTSHYKARSFLFRPRLSAEFRKTVSGGLSGYFGSCTSPIPTIFDEVRNLR